MALKTGQEIAAVEFENIPQEMKDIPNWVLWKKVATGKGYDTKVPIQPDGNSAMTNEPSTWATFESVQQAHESGVGDGIGIVFNNSHRLYALDIDGTTDHEYIDTHGQHTYCEYSPSGGGVHVYFMADKPKESRKNGLHDDGLELFSGSGFTTVTGNMRTSADEIIDNDSLIEKLIADEFPPDEYSLGSVDYTEPLEIDTPKHNLTKEEVIKAMTTKSPYKDEIIQLLRGEYVGDRSTAVWNLMNQLAYWTARNEEMMWDIFTSYGMYDPDDGKRKTREQYDELRRLEIRKAIMNKTKVYEPYGVAAENDFEIHVNQDGTIAKSEYGSTKKIQKHGWWVYSTDENGETKGKPKFMHHYMAWYVLQNYHIVRFPDADGDLYIYSESEGYYEIDKVTRKLKGIIRGLSANLTNNQVTEVRNYIVDMSKVETEINTDYAAVGNGLVRFKDKTFHKFTPAIFITQKIPTNYNPNAYDSFIDKTINKAASFHKPTIENIKEMFGMIIYPKMLVPKMIYLLGVSANNGKSTSLNMARKALDPGGEISAVSPQSLNAKENKFAVASMYGKMANIVDDLPDITVTDTGILKAVITAGYVEIEYKNKGSFSVQMNTPFMVASNHYPKFKEHGVQINKRLHIIPFEYNFLEDDEYISESESMQLIETDSAKEYVLKLGIDALYTMLHRTGEILTPNDKAEQALDEFSSFNNPLSEYFLDFDKDYFADTTGMNAYRDYEKWCEQRLVRDVLSMADYKTAVMTHYDFVWKDVKYKVNGEWKTTKGFKPRK